MVTLNQYLKAREAEYWHELLRSYPDRNEAAKIAGVHVATLYRRLAEIPRCHRTELPRRRQTGATLILRPFRRKRGMMPTLLEAFGVKVNRDEWSRLERRGPVVELERIYHDAHQRYRTYMRRCHPDVCRNPDMDPGVITAQWVAVKRQLRRAFANCGADF